MTTQNIYDLTDTWNAGGTTFTAIKMNVTDTASASGSLLMDLQVGGVSQEKTDKSGNKTLVGAITLGIGSSSSPAINFGAGGMIYRGASQGATAVVLGSAGNDVFAVLQNTASGVVLAGPLNFSSAISATADTILTRDAANTLAQRNSTNAQTFRVYGTFTDASNLRRLVMNMSAAGVAEIKPEGLGTGASGNVLHISGLPTANPGAGILWNNGGTVEVGT
jgi:hypothetical protein